MSGLTLGNARVLLHARPVCHAGPGRVLHRPPQFATLNIRFPVSEAQIVGFLVAVGFAAGLNVYATTAVLGLLGRAGMLDLPGSLDAVESWWVIGVCLALWGVEFIADKIPAFDVLWNLAQSVVRIPVAAVIGYAGASDLGPATQAAASGAGALLAALAAGGKAATHASVAPSPEPFSNIALSLVEDGVVIFLVWFATSHPILAALIALTLAAVIVLLVRTVWRLIKGRGRIRDADQVTAG